MGLINLRLNFEAVYLQVPGLKLAFLLHLLTVWNSIFQ